MIFVSIALLVVAAIALGIGIVSSSVAPLVVSVLATLAAAGTLWASFIHYRKEAADQGLAVVGLGGNQPRQPGYPESYAPNGHLVAPVPSPAAPSVPPTAAGPTPPAAAAAAPVPPGWDDLADHDATQLVTAFNLDELHALRRHEVEHARRPAVMAEIDQRITTIVDLQRRAARA